MVGATPPLMIQIYVEFSLIIHVDSVDIHILYTLYLGKLFLDLTVLPHWKS